MELRHLRYFVALGRCLNFTKAAESLHISQPPLSRQIQEFEEEVGAQLFLRQGKTTSLTPAGEFLLAECERILREVEAACGSARAIAQEARALRIGCVSSFLMGEVFAAFLKQMRRDRPELKLEIQVLNTENQEKALLSGRLDIGFVRSWVGRTGLAFEPVAEETMAIVHPSRFGPYSRPEACLEELADIPFIVLSPSSGAGLAARVGEILAAHHLDPRKAYACNDTRSIAGMIASGLGWSILPGVELAETGRSGIASLYLDESVVIGMSYRPTGIPSPALEFIEAARAYFGHEAA